MVYGISDPQAASARLVLEALMLVVGFACAWEVLNELAEPLAALFIAQGRRERSKVWKRFSRWWGIDIAVVGTQLLVLTAYVLQLALAYRLAGVVRADYHPYDTRKGDAAAVMMLKR